MIFHPQIKKVSQYLDGTLEQQKRAQLEAHLSQCEACKKKVELLSAASSVVQLSKEKLETALKKVSDGVMEGVETRAWQPSAPVIGEVESVVGSVMVNGKGEEEGVEAFPGLTVRKGDALMTNGESRALVRLNDGSHLYVNQESTLDFPPGKFNLGMKVGEIFAMMKPQEKSYLIQTPAAMLAVVGTDFDARVTEQKQTVLKVVKGSVYFKNDYGNVLVKKRRQVEAVRDVKPVPVRIKDTRPISAWTGSITPKKKEGGWIMKKLSIAIVAIVALVAVAAGGYWLYNEYFTYEPSPYRPTVSTPAEATVPAATVPESSPPESPAIAETEAAAPPSAIPEQPSVVEEAATTVKLPHDETLISRVKMQPGKRYILQIDSITDSTTDRSDSLRPMKTKARFSQQIAFSVVRDTPGGGQEVELEFLRVALQMNLADGEAFVDSASPTPPEVKDPMAQALWSLVKAMSGTKLRMYVNADDEIERIDGVEQLMERIKASAPPMMVTILQGFLNEDTMKEMSSTYGEALPEHEVKVGDSWKFTHKIQVPMLGKLRTDTSYYFSKWEEHMGRACAVLEINGTISAKPGSDELLPGVQMTLKESTISGKSWYDPAIGMNIDSTMTQNLNMDIRSKVRGRRGMREEKATLRQMQYITTKLIGIEDIQ